MKISRHFQTSPKVRDRKQIFSKTDSTENE